jgi:hypothetical protein
MAIINQYKQAKAISCLLRVAIRGRWEVLTKLPSFVNEEIEDFEVLIKRENARRRDSLNQAAEG